MVRFKKILAENTEEIILVLLIILNATEFLMRLSPELDFIDNIIDLTALGYLFHKLSITKIFFGRRQMVHDLLIVLAFFLLFSKTLIGYSEVARNEIVEHHLPDIIRFSNTSAVPLKEDRVIFVNVASIDLPTTQEIGKRNYISILRSIMAGKRVFVNMSDSRSSRLIQAYTIDMSMASISDFSDAKMLARTSILFFFQRVAENKPAIEYLLFVLGGSILLILSVYFAFYVFIDKPSMMHAIQEDGPPPASFAARISRALVIFLALNFFFIVIFNYGMEWFALSVDSPLIIIMFFIYFFIWVKHHKRYAAESFIYKLGDAGEKLYGRIVVLFHSKRGIMLGLSGMLVLHLITDVANFIIPYSLFTQGTYDPLYFGHLGMERTPLWSIHNIFGASRIGLIYSDLEGTAGIAAFSVMYIYAMNIIAMLILLALPTGLWYLIFQEKKISVPGPVIALFFASITAFIISPLFRTGRIVSNSIVGVDITTQTIQASARMVPSNILYLSIAAGMLALLLSLSERIKKHLVVSCIFLSLVYFVIYIYNFFMDVSNYYIVATSESIHSGQFFASAYFLVFLMITFIFYTGGFALFMYGIITSGKEEIKSA